MEFDQYKKKTYTKYWNNFAEKPKIFIGTSIFLKKLKLKLIKFLGFKISIRIKQLKKEIKKRIKRRKINLEEDYL